MWNYSCRSPRRNHNPHFLALPVPSDTSGPKFIAYHLEDIFPTLDRALSTSFTTVIFGVDHVKEGILQTISLLVIMAGLGTLWPIC